MLNPGDRFDRYRVVRKLGEGGMATVYEAENTFGLSVVLKLLNADLANDPDVVERFRREGRIQFTLKHPHIVRVTDIVEDRGVPALVIDFLRGEDLEVALERGQRFTVAESLDMAIKLLDGLHVAHEHGFIHRDLKPSNVFLEKTDLGYEPRLMDFGIAKIQQASALTRAQEFCGTPAYSSPEQIESTRDVDRRSDVYSMGIVLWQLLSHRMPWGDYDDAIRVMMAVVREKLPALPQEVPAWLRQVVERATAKTADARFPTAAAFREALIAGVATDPALRDNAALSRLPLADDTPPPDAVGRNGRATVLTPTATADTVGPSQTVSSGQAPRAATRPAPTAAGAIPGEPLRALANAAPAPAAAPPSAPVPRAQPQRPAPPDETGLGTALDARAGRTPSPQPTPRASRPSAAPIPAPTGAAQVPGPSTTPLAASGSRTASLPPPPPERSSRPRLKRILGLTSVVVSTVVLVPLLALMAWDIFKQPESLPDGFIRVEPGQYLRGSPETELGRLPDEVQQQVTISYPLAVQRREVSLAEYEMLLMGRANPFRACGENCPAVNVGWMDAIEYANMRSSREGFEPCYVLVGAGSERRAEWPLGLECEGYRLPTEAEWEYFARAGSTGAFSSGEITVTGRGAPDPRLTEIAVYGANSHAPYLGAVDCSSWGEGFETCGPAPVGSRRPNAWGLYDVSGNAAEWVADGPGPWTATPATDPVGEFGGRSRVVRGGSWMDVAERCRLAARRETQPLGRMDVGFRLVRRLRQ